MTSKVYFGILDVFTGSDNRAPEMNTLKFGQNRASFLASKQHGRCIVELVTNRRFVGVFEL